MNEIIVETIPKIKEEENTTLKIKAMVEDRNKIIAKRFNFDVLDVKVKLYFSKQKLLTAIRNTGDSLGIFCGYLDDEDSIHLIHPHMVQSIFKENLDKEYIIMIDYCLTKYYMNKKYYPEKSMYKIYYRHLTEELAKISSGNFREDIVKFDMKTFVEGKRYSKDKEIAIVLYIMLENSGLDFIYNHLDEMVEDLDIKKTIFKIYKKSLWDLVIPYQKDLKEEERKLQLKFKQSKR